MISRLNSFHTIFCLFLLSSIIFSCSSESKELTPLEKYVKTRTEDFSYEIKDTLSGDKWKAYHVKMYSGKWLDESQVDQPLWWHWVDIIVPEELDHETAMLFVGGGTNKDEKFLLDSTAVGFALKTNSVIAQVSNIPFQPINYLDVEQKEFYEDDLIAYGWDKFLKSGAEDSSLFWLARFPMTRAVVRAMDVIQEIHKSEKSIINSFFIAGASKRGWTTWTTAAVDKRVVGISPIVIDMLNVVPNFDHHYQCYGEFSPAVQDYVNYKVVDWMDSKEYEKLIAEVEPYNFKEKFTMPKFIINAASDEFFVTDSWQFYWDDLPGEKHLRYVPNAGHSLEGTYQLENLASFYYRFLNNINQPNWNWKINNDTIFVNINQGQNYKIAKWEVNNPKERDFRIYKIGKTWQKTDIETNDKGHYAIPVKSTDGYTAALVEVVFDPNGDNPLILSTGTLVTPKEYPFEKYVPEKSLGSKNN